jgi:hypothetical protein
LDVGGTDLTVFVALVGVAGGEGFGLMTPFATAASVALEFGGDGVGGEGEVLVQ